MLTIRRYEDADRKAVWSLHNRALRDVDAHAGNGPWDEDLHRVREAYLDAGGEFLVGVEDGRIAAMGALARTGPDTAEIKRMRVEPDRQRRGHGRAILAALEARAAELGVRALLLHTTAGQTAARRLYEGAGYREGRRCREGRFEVIEYRKALPPPADGR